MSRLPRLAVAGLCIASLYPLAFAQKQKKKSLPPPQAQEYCAQASQYAKENPDSALYFSALPQNRDPARDQWQRLPSLDALHDAGGNDNSTAVVALRNGSAILVDFTFQNQFGDFEEFAQYCYRPDSSLAYIHSDLKSYHAGLELVRDVWFDNSGGKLEKASHTFDLHTHKPAKLPADFWDLPPPEFLRLRDLPFAGDLPGKP